MDSKAACAYDLKLALQTQPGTQGEQNLEEGKVAVIVAGPMLCTNVISTFLIAWKAWCAKKKPPFLSALLTDAPKGIPPGRGYAAQKGQPFRAFGESSCASD